jgi:asparagine synthase (glutamine-hydrolysing)
LEIREICFRLRRLLEESVRRNPAEGILLSGGLDTSIIAQVASVYQRLKGVTVAFREAFAPDVAYAKLMAEKLEIEHKVHYLSWEELLSEFPVAVRILNSFDPMEIRNSVVILVALRVAKDEGLKTVFTGDGADELFAGYSFLFKYSGEELQRELEKMWRNMCFSSIVLASHLGLDVKLPYLDEEFQNFAKQIEPGLKVRRVNGDVYGKWILRKAFEEILPPSIVWRVKTPIEQGAGTSCLTKIFDRLIGDEEFEEKKRNYQEVDGVEVRDKEHLFYYEIFRREVGVPSPKNPEEKTCPKCHSNVKSGSTYCRTCGAYPI